MKTSVLAGTLLAGSLAFGAEWDQWRGPNGNGYLEKGSIPLEFAQDKAVAWKMELPGRGCSTPIVAGGKLFLTGPIEAKDSVVAYDLKGKELWRQSYGEQTPGRGQKVGSGANSSPVTDGKMVFGYFKSGRVVGLTNDGKKVWETNLVEKYGEDTLWWDQGTSPVLAGGHLVIAVMQTEGNSYLVALNKETGVEEWKTDRKFDVGKETGDSYTTPHVTEVEGVETIVSFGADHVTGHEAKSGKLLWTCGGQNPKKENFWRVIASSVLADDIVVVPYGRAKFLLGVRVGGAGDVTESNVVWKKEGVISTDAATPVAMKGNVLILADRGKERGTVTMIDASSGDPLWVGKLPKSAATYYASPIVVGDTLCAPREDGTVVMAKLNKDGLGEIKVNKLPDSFIASPIVADGKLILRGSEHLWAIK